MPAFEDKSDRIRSEAAAWVARLDRDDSEATREEFTQWASADPAHRPAYDRAHGRYSQSVLIRQSPISRQVSLNSEFPKRSPGLARGAIAAGIAGLLLLSTFQLTTGRLFGPPLQAAMLSSGSSARQVELDDGSSLTLDPSSQLRIDLTRSERRAELTRGRARIVIAPEDRPFLLKVGAREEKVAAGDFVLAIGPDESSITPLSPSTATGETYERSPTVMASRPASLARIEPMDFSATPLAEVAARANRTANGPAIEVDPRIAGIPVTGLFQVGDNQALARSLAAALDLESTAMPSGAIRLEARRK